MTVFEVLLLAVVAAVIWGIVTHKIDLAKLKGQIQGMIDSRKPSAPAVVAPVAPAPVVDHAAIIQAAANVVAAAQPAQTAAASAAPPAPPPVTSSPTAALFGQSAEELVARAAREAQNAADALRAGNASGQAFPPGYDLDANPTRRNPAQAANTYYPYTLTITQVSPTGNAVINIATVAGDGGDGGEWTAFMTKDGTAGPETSFTAHDFAVYQFPSVPGVYIFNLKRDRAGGVTIQFKPNG